jgi:sulfite exporter TauE/SafE/copper chaperone CopZ
MALKKINFEVEGIHCKSCKTLLETEVDVLMGVNNINVDYQTGRCWVEFDDLKISFSKIKDKIEEFDYKVVDLKNKKVANSRIADKEENKSGFSGFAIGLLIPFILIGLVVVYFLFKNFGGFSILAKLNESNLSYGLIFLIGFLVSFHCIGMCGGLVVTYSATIAAKSAGKKTSISLPHIQYNLGRLISYTVIGGILGGIGSFFAINPNFSGAMMLFAGLFMLLMAVALFTNFKALEKIIPKMPQFIARFLYNQKHDQNPKGPFFIGLLNGLMPCGPLQAMQLYALGTGSISRGALSMGVYALGTIPLMFGFGAFISKISQRYIGRVMKFSAIVVGILGLIMFNRGLTNFNLGLKSLIPKESVSQVQPAKKDDSNVQIARMDLTFRGYEPNVLYIKKGILVRWIINVKQMSGCTNEIILHGGYNIRKKLQKGENVIEFTPLQSGQIEFSCWMQMVWGKFIVE